MVKCIQDKLVKYQNIAEQGYKNSLHFYSAIQKYGWQNFKHEILYTNLSLEKANIIEQELIQKYQSTNPKFGYNSTPGGKSRIPNDQTRQLQSLSASQRPIITDETKAKLSKINVITINKIETITLI